MIYRIKIRVEKLVGLFAKEAFLFCKQTGIATMFITWLVCVDCPWW
jgi:hypothetical protein